MVLPTDLIRYIGHRKTKPSQVEWLEGQINANFDSNASERQEIRLPDLIIS